MFSVGEIDVKGLQQFKNLLGALGKDAPKAVNSALNHTGGKARTQVVRTLAKQTGLPQKLIRRAVKVKRSVWSDLEYRLSAAGGSVSLKYFRIRETRRGVTAYLGEARGRELFEGAFFRGGRFPNRVGLSIGNDHVFQRIGVRRLPIEQVKSDVFIPVEMVEGASADVFERTVAEHLPHRMSHEISRLPGL